MQDEVERAVDLAGLPKTRATSSSFWTSQGVTSLAPIGSASLRTRRSILSPGRWVKPISAPSASSFRLIAQAMLKSLATPSTTPFFPVNRPIDSILPVPVRARSNVVCLQRFVASTFARG